MSNHLAIAAVTLTLRDLFREQVKAAFLNAPDDLKLTNQLSIGMVPPDKVRTSFQTDNVINIFLYRTEINAALRNALAQNARPGEQGYPPVALNLDYLISVHPESDREAVAHYFLGQVMRVLNDEAILSRDRIRTALEAADLHRQVESVTVTPKPLSIDEMSKLWTIFQTPYRTSVVYLVTVVLIESLRPTRAALPVLTRGKDDRGVFSNASGILAVTDVKPATKQPGVRLGEDLTVRGQAFRGGLTALLRHALLRDAIPITPVVVSDTEVTVHIPGAGDVPHVPADWPAGFWRLSLQVAETDVPHWTTNEMAFGLAPTIVLTPINPNTGTFTVELSVTPQLREEQDALLLFGNHQVSIDTMTGPADEESPTTLTFEVTVSEAGPYPVRLRIDGVDSIPFLRKVSGMLEFDPAQTVVVT
jgi:hypothetical protein